MTAVDKRFPRPRRNRWFLIAWAEPRSLLVGSAARSCITAGTSFAQMPPSDVEVWRAEANQICSQRLSGVALDLLRTRAMEWAGDRHTGHAAGF